MVRFMADQNRGISLNLFSDLAGTSVEALRKIFVNQTRDLDEMMQIRLSKVLQSWEAGEIAVMEGRHRTRFAEYRKVARPRLARTWGLKVTPEGFKVDARVRNKADYGQETLVEQMERVKWR